MYLLIAYLDGKNYFPVKYLAEANLQDSLNLRHVIFVA
jgi:hypothetical protein